MTCNFDAETLSEVFDAFDKDGSGHIDSDELTSVCSEIGVPADVLREVFQSLDADGNGKICKDEFVHGFRNISEILGSKKGLFRTDSESKYSSEKNWDNFVRDMEGCLNKLPKDRYMIV